MISVASAKQPATARARFDEYPVSPGIRRAVCDAVLNHMNVNTRTLRASNCLFRCARYNLFNRKV